MSQVCEFEAFLKVSGVLESHTYVRSPIGGRICNINHTQPLQKHLDVDDDADNDFCRVLL